MLPEICLCVAEPSYSWMSVQRACPQARKCHSFPAKKPHPALRPSLQQQLVQDMSLLHAPGACKGPVMACCHGPPRLQQRPASPQLQPCACMALMGRLALLGARPCAQHRLLFACLHLRRHARLCTDIHRTCSARLVRHPGELHQRRQGPGGRRHARFGVRAASLANGARPAVDRAGVSTWLSCLSMSLRAVKKLEAACLHASEHHLCFLLCAPGTCCKQARAVHPLTRQLRVKRQACDWLSALTFKQTIFLVAWTHHAEPSSSPVA